MTNPFKKITTNAETTKGKSQYQQQRFDTVVDTKTCFSCGAPRPKNTNLVQCDYCRTRFMDDVGEFKSDS